MRERERVHSVRTRRMGQWDMGGRVRLGSILEREKSWDEL